MVAPVGVRQAVVSGAIALAAVALLAQRSEGAPSGCVPAGARTVAAAGRARLYVEGSELFGCLGSARTLLGGAPGARRVGATRVARFALASPYAGIATLLMGVDTLASSVSIVDLRTRATVASTPATTLERLPESFVDVSAIAIDDRGTAAWIGSRSAIGAPTPIYEVHTLTSAGAERLLASSAAIAPDSLRLRGATLSWRQDGRRRIVTIA
jgi:hypothetical protein